ncbi:MAG: hypothetical protein ABH840_00665, partial [Nanoarchaeota archaeon]
CYAQLRYVRFEPVISRAKEYTGRVYNSIKRQLKGKGQPLDYWEQMDIIIARERKSYEFL